jgi:hypothetical protein
VAVRISGLPVPPPKAGDELRLAECEGDDGVLCLTRRGEILARVWRRPTHIELEAGSRAWRLAAYGKGWHLAATEVGRETVAWHTPRALRPSIVTLGDDAFLLSRGADRLTTQEGRLLLRFHVTEADACEPVVLTDVVALPAQADAKLLVAFTTVVVWLRATAPRPSSPDGRKHGESWWDDLFGAGGGDAGGGGGGDGGGV